MKLTLNYAILKHFTRVEKASANEIMVALEKDFATHRAFKKDSIIESLMTAKENGLIDEIGYELQGDELVVFYGASEEQKNTINKYI